jgi:hypothetical protein
MPGDFEILRPPKAPYWRDSKYRAKVVGVERFVLISLSVTSAGLACLPSRLGVLQPISLELAAGNRASWILFGLLGLALVYLFAKFVSAGLYVSSMMCMLAVAGLSCIAFTNPYSFGHLCVFGALSLLVPCWLASLALELGGWRLVSSSIICLVGVMVCPGSLGLGERIILIGALFGLNSVFYEHVLV